MVSSRMESAPGSLRIARGDIRSEDAQLLLAALDAELTARYPEEPVSEWRLEPDEVSPGQGAFVVAFRDQRLVGCCALRRLEDGSGEVKRMYVRPEERGRGAAKQLLQAIEAEARALGLVRLVLETGVRQPEAIKVYERGGFTRIAPFGHYVDSPLSVCMGKDLSKDLTASLW
jgi:putative acetyltransferase